MKAFGKLTPMSNQPMLPGEVKQIAYQIMTPEQIKELEANQALDRIINLFPEERHKQLFMDLSLNLQGFVSQRLIPTVDGKRAAAIEIMLGTPRVCDLIKQGKVDEIKEVMEKSENQGMKTFDSALYDLYKAGQITLAEAMKNADSKNNLRLKIQLSEGKKASADENEGGLSLEPKDEGRHGH